MIEVVVAAAATPLEGLATGADWDLCAALLTLHAIADEACAGLGVALAASNPLGCGYRGRARACGTEGITDVTEGIAIVGPAISKSRVGSRMSVTTSSTRQVIGAQYEQIHGLAVGGPASSGAGPPSSPGDRPGRG